MALPLIVDSVDEVPEQVRGFYKADADGKRFVLDTDGNGDDLGELKRALEREKAERRKYAKLAEERAGIDPEQFKKLQAAEEQRQREDAEKKGHYDKLLAQKDADFSKDLGKKEAELKAALSAVERYVLDAEIAQAVASHKGKLRLLSQLVKAQLKAVNDAGQYRVVVVDADGDERRNPKTNAPMTVSELVAEMKADPDLGGAFEPSGATGGGASVANTGARGVDNSKLTPYEKLQRAYGTGSN